jgi:hypothetical protein
MGRRRLSARQSSQPSAHAKSRLRQADQTQIRAKTKTDDWTCSVTFYSSHASINDRRTEDIAVKESGGGVPCGLMCGDNSVQTGYHKAQRQDRYLMILSLKPKVAVSFAPRSHRNCQNLARVARFTSSLTSQPLCAEKLMVNVLCQWSRQGSHPPARWGCGCIRGRTSSARPFSSR